MGENKENIENILEKLTIITDAANQLFPEGKSILVYELNDENFREVQKNFREIDKNKLRFKIEISDREIVFINTKLGYYQSCCNYLTALAKWEKAIGRKGQNISKN